MSSNWGELLRIAWADLAQYPPQSKRFRTRRLSSDLALDAHAGLRAADDAPCLIIETPTPSNAAFEVGGMRLSAAMGEACPLLVLSLEDRTRLDLFTTLCADTLSVAASAGFGAALPAFLSRLHAWRSFLREQRSGLTVRETIGLIGELIVLGRVLALDENLLDAWTSPDRGLHDFLHKGHALEIKTTLGAATALRVSTLDQLDGAGLGRLDLIHLRMAEATTGYNLQSLIDDVVGRLPDEATVRVFENALLRRGLMPGDTAARAAPVTSLQSLITYSVSEDFPRLVRSAVPSGIAEAEYFVELRSIGRHTVDSDTTFNAFVGRSRLE